jgi:hypothetical protein
MTLRISVKVTRTGSLSQVARQQIPFALANALNKTANDVQRQVQEGLNTRFTIAPQRTRFMARLIKRRKGEDSATKASLVARVRVEGPETVTGRDPAAPLLTRHEQGGTHTRPPDLTQFYLPTDEIRPSDRSLVPRALYPSSLRLVPRRSPDGVLPAKKRGKVRTLAGKAISNRARRAQGLEGVGGTFTINDPDTGRPLGIYQRTGRGRRDLRKLWSFRTKVSLRPRLAFHATAKQVVPQRISENFSRALAQAIRTARPKR